MIPDGSKHDRVLNIMIKKKPRTFLYLQKIGPTPKKLVYEVETS